MGGFASFLGPIGSIVSGMMGGSEPESAKQRVIHEAPAAKETADEIDRSEDLTKTKKNTGRRLLQVDDMSTTGGTETGVN